jgi:hypothetical protein
MKNQQAPTFTGNLGEKRCISKAHHPRGSGSGSKIHAPRKIPRPGWVHYRFLPSLLGSNQKRRLGSSRGIENISSGPPGPQCNLPNSHSERRKIHKSQRV